MKKLLSLALVLMLGTLAGCSHYQSSPAFRPSSAPRRGSLDPAGLPPVATFSIVAYDPVNQEWGVAVQSKFFGVGSVVPWAKAGVGAIATQSYANIHYGEHGLRHLDEGRSAEETVQLLTGSDEGRNTRQLGVVDKLGRAASFTGSKCNAWAGHVAGTNFAVQGNILAGEAVVKDMAAAFEKGSASQQGELADWLVAALEAGQKAGGDTRGQQSAALLVVRKGAGYGGTDRFVDLRVEDHTEPIKELGRLLEVHKRFYARAHKPRGSKEPTPR